MKKIMILLVGIGLSLGLCACLPTVGGYAGISKGGEYGGLGPTAVNESCSVTLNGKVVYGGNCADAFHVSVADGGTLHTPYTP